jgi:hypothetical protein
VAGNTIGTLCRDSPGGARAGALDAAPVDDSSDELIMGRGVRFRDGVTEHQFDEVTLVKLAERRMPEANLAAVGSCGEELSDGRVQNGMDERGR